MKIERIVITGGRDFADGARIEADLRTLLPLGLRRVAQGGHGVSKQLGQAEVPARFVSADTLAWLATHSLGLEEATYTVDHAVDGPWPAAGPRRNVRMLEAERPPLVLAYPDLGSRGTWHCVAAALRQGVTVAVWAPCRRLTDVLGGLRFDFPDVTEDAARFVLAPPTLGREHREAVAKILRGAA